MRLIFDGTYDELIDKILSKYNKLPREHYVDSSMYPMIRIMKGHDGDGNRALDTEYIDGKTVITPHNECVYEPKSHPVKQTLYNALRRCMIFAAFLSPWIIAWTVFFDPRFWFAVLPIAALEYYVFYRIMKRSDEYAWQKIYVFLIRDVGCRRAPDDDGKV